MTAIVPTDVLFMLSAPGAAAGNTTAGTVGNSLGKYVSTTQLSATPLDNLFLDITGAQNAASQVDYACVFILNNTSSGNSMLNTVVWLPLSLFVAGGANVALAGDNIAASAKGTSSQQAAVIGTSTTLPTGITSFVSPVSSAPVFPSYTGGIQLGTIGPNQVRAVWIRRSATNSAPVNNDGFTLEVDFDTQA